MMKIESNHGTCPGAYRLDDFRPLDIFERYRMLFPIMLEKQPIAIQGEELPVKNHPHRKPQPQGADHEQSQHQPVTAAEQGHTRQREEVRDGKGDEEGEVRPLQFVRQRDVVRGGCVHGLIKIG